MPYMNQWPAWCVHVYTASGAIMGLAGVIAVTAGDYRQAFAWMFLATFVDGTDGVLARRARVKERTPGFDGARLDDIVDYLTFVFLPAFLLVHAGLLPAPASIAVASAMLLSSAYGFASLDAKTTDHYFTGFPSYWNIVALYIAVLGLAPWINAAIVVALAAMVFVRIGYVYPSRTPTLRLTTLALMVAWGVMLLPIIWWMPQPPRALVLASLVFPVYYVLLSFVLHLRRAR
jgi:phosphatidylcholine synthase